MLHALLISAVAWTRAVAFRGGIQISWCGGCLHGRRHILDISTHEDLQIRPFADIGTVTCVPCLDDYGRYTGSLRNQSRESASTSVWATLV